MKSRASRLCRFGRWKPLWRPRAGLSRQFGPGPELKESRLQDEKEAASLQAKCNGQPATLTSLEQKPGTRKPPLLYDLTSLQREANARFGLSAKDTLAGAQALYETHKAVTYPRTD